MYKRQILHYLDEYLEEFLMVIFLIAMTLIMGIQVFSRYILGMSLSWSEEITRYLFIWAAFLSVSRCTRKCLSLIHIEMCIRDRVEAAKYIDELSPAAQIIGAINTIVNDNGKLTDVYKSQVPYRMAEAFILMLNQGMLPRSYQEERRAII